MSNATPITVKTGSGVGIKKTRLSPKALSEFLKTFNESLKLFIVIMIVLEDWPTRLIMVIALFLIHWRAPVRYLKGKRVRPQH